MFAAVSIYKSPTVAGLVVGNAVAANGAKKVVLPVVLAIDIAVIALVVSFINPVAHYHPQA